MFDDDDQYVTQSEIIPVEIARVVPALCALTRNDFRDSNGFCVEAFNAEPSRFEQLKHVLNCVKHRVCAASVGQYPDARACLDSFVLDAADFEVQYIQLTREVSNSSAVVIGYRLMVKPSRFPLIPPQIDQLRRLATAAALSLLEGGDVAPLRDEEAAALGLRREHRRHERAAEKHRAQLKGKRVQQPFTFSAGVSDLDFDGHFWGEEEENFEPESAKLRGYITHVVYRGMVLSFELEIEELLPERNGKSYVIEYIESQRADVHRLAGDSGRPVWIDAELRKTRLATGQFREIYTLVSAASAKHLDRYREEDEVCFK